MRYLLFIFFALLFACNNSNTGNENTKTVVVLYDLSISADTLSRADYIAETKFITDAMQPGDVFMAHAITDKSIREKEELCNIRFPVNTNTSTNQFAKQEADKKINQLMEASRRDASEKINNALHNPQLQFKYTDIFSALVLAQQLFANYTSENSILVIMSDMIESDSQYEFSKLELNEKKAQQIISELKNANAFPNLTGVTVYVCGANASSNNRYYAIRDFWKAYFTEAGAQLSDNNYGTSLKAFNP